MLLDLLLECKTSYGDHPAFRYCQGQQIRAVAFQTFFSDVMGARDQFARWPEQRIGLWAYNSYEWIVSATALLLAGKTAVLLDGNLGLEALVRLSRYTEVERLLADEEMMDEEEEIRPYVPMTSLAGIRWGEPEAEVRGPEATVREPGPEVRGPEAAVQEPGPAVRKQPEGEAAVERRAEGRFVCFTSGTSKSARGVVLTAESLCGPVRSFENLMEEAGENVYLPLPYHHIYAFVHIYRLLYYGKTICLGKMGRHLMEDIQAMRPDILMCVPSILKYLTEQDDFPEHLKLVFTAGSYLRPELASQITRRQVKLYNLYGLSETMGSIAHTVPGKGSQWMEPDRGIRFLVGQEGELGVILPWHMEEYYKKPEETRQVLIKEEHLVWTGDACEMDTEGYVRILGRLRDMIVLENGEKIHAEDTDAELSRFLGVKEAAVIYVGEELVAVFVPESEDRQKSIAGALKEYNRNRPAGIQIRKVWFRESGLPRTAIGKLKRAALEEEYRLQ